jgi:cytochrome c553
MRGLAGSLSDKDIADLAAFYQQQSGAAAALPETPAAASPEVAALLTKGACASCHGANFSKPIDPGYPKIAGQHADYLYVALRSYAAEGNPQVGRANPIMGAQVKPFSRAELKAMADYLATLPGDLRTVPQSKFR